MPKAIATQLESLINIDTELIALNQADSYWQEKIGKTVIDSTDAIYLVFPPTVSSLAAIVREAHQQQWRLLICGNGSKLDWGGITQKIQLVISTQKCDRLMEHAVGDLTVTVEGGMKLQDLQKQLSKHQQFLPLDPAYPQEATIGGIIATANTGSWRQRYGGIRDLLLGISFIRADGKIAKAGGRVVKNVAGYDLMKLFTGAYGTLGIISQATFRTYPLPPASKTLLLSGKETDIAQVSQIIRNSGLTPTALDLLSASVIKQLNLGTNLGLAVRFQSIPASVTQQATQIQDWAQQYNLTAHSYQDREETELWQTLKKIIYLNDEKSIICKLGILPNAAVKLMQQLHDETKAIIHAGSGLGQLHLTSEAVAEISQLRSLLGQDQGFLTILSAPLDVKQQLDVWGYQGNALDTMNKIKNQFDPQNILNPGRFVGNI